MNSIILPQSDVMLASCKKVSKICQPLGKLGITGFSYTRLYDNGTFIDVCSNAQVIENFYYDNTKLYRYYVPDISPEILQGDYFICNSTALPNRALDILRSDFNMDNILVIIKRRGCYFELFNFAAHKDNDQIINFYLNNLNIFESFIYYFRNDARDLITRYDTDRIIRPNLAIDEKLHKSFIEYCSVNENSYKKFQANRYYIDGSDDIYLTSREMDCLNWCVKGKTAEEIALLLNISKRTTEVHLSNLKNKLGCYKQTDLVRKAIACNLI